MVTLLRWRSRDRVERALLERREFVDTTAHSFFLAVFTLRLAREIAFTLDKTLLDSDIRRVEEIASEHGMKGLVLR